MKRFMQSWFVLAAMIGSAHAGSDCAYGGGSSKLAVPALLLTLAAGYWVLTIAQNQERRSQLIGRIIGWVILLVSVGGLVCAAAFGFCKMRGACADKAMSGAAKMSCHVETPAQVPQK